MNLEPGDTTLLASTAVFKAEPVASGYNDSSSSSKPNFKSKPKKHPTDLNYNASSDPFKIKNFDFINKGYMNDRVKILKQKCKEYVKAIS